MAYTFLVNNLMSTQVTPAYHIWNLIATLISAGWTKVMDSDGTTYSAVGTQVTGPNTGTNGLDNSRAWVRLQAPAVNGGSVVDQTREFTFQRGTASNLDWRIKYSASGSFNGAASPATTNQTPSSPDEIFMIGGGTDASPTFYTWLYDNTEVQRYHIVAGGADEFYSFASWVTGTTNATLAVNHPAIFMDVMAPGSFPSVDVDPAVVFISSSGNSGISSQIHATTPPTTTVTNPCLARAWFGPTSAAGASITSNNVNVGTFTYGNFHSTSIGTNPWTNKDDMFPLWYGTNQSTGKKGIKGISTLFKAGTIIRGQMVVGETSPGAKNKVYIDYYWAPWNGSGTLL